MAKITLLPAYQSLSGAWYVPWRADTGERNEMKYVGRLPDEASITADVQKHLDLQTAQAAQDLLDAEAQRIADQKAALDGMKLQVVDSKGAPIVGAVVKVSDATTDTPLKDVTSAASAEPVGEVG